MSGNWWEAAPLTEEPQASAPGNWWESAPMAGQEDASGSYDFPRSMVQDAGRGVGLGVRSVMRGLTAIPGALYDAVGVPINLAAGAMGLPQVRSAASNVDRLGDAVGLPTAETSNERIMGRAVQELAGLPVTAGAGLIARGGGQLARNVGNGLLAMPGAQIAGAAGAGLAGGAAQEAGYGPVGELGAALAGGMAGGLAPGLVRGGFNMTTSAIDPFRQAGRDRIVGEAIMRNSSAGDGVSGAGGLAARLRAGLDDTNARLPGSPVTMSQAARDPGLAILESGLRSIPPDPASPPGAFNPAAFSRDIEARRDTLRNAQMAGMVPPVGDVADSGQAIRDVLRPAEVIRRSAIRGAYQGIPNDGSSAALPSAPVRDALDEAVNTYFGAGTTGPPAELQAVMRIVEDMGSAAPFRTMQGLRSEASQMIDQGGRAGNERLVAAAKSVRDAIDGAAASAGDEQFVLGRALTDAERLQQEALRGARARPDVAYAARVPTERGGETSLVQWVINNGGLKHDGGDLASVMGGRLNRRPGLANQNGQQMDIAAQNARDAGFFPEFSSGQRSDTQDTLSGQDLMRAIEDELTGRNVRYLNGGARRQAAADDRALIDAVGREMDQRGLSGLRGDDLLRAVQDDGGLPPVASFTPDERFTVPDAMTPEEAARWREATAMRRELSRDFQRDESGASAVGRVMAGGPSPTMGVASVPATILRSVADTQQALRAAGPEGGRVRQALGDEWLRGLRDAMTSTSEKFDTAGNSVQGTLPGAARRYIERRMDVGRIVLSEDQLRQVTLLGNDLSETAAAQGSAAARGSNTAQNLALGNMFARLGSSGSESASIGLQGAIAAGGGLAGAMMGGPFGSALGGMAGAAAGGAAPLAMRRIYAAPERAMREQLAQALLNPRDGLALLDRLKPASVARGARRGDDFRAAYQGALARRLLGIANTAAQSRAE